MKNMMPILVLMVSLSAPSTCTAQQERLPGDTAVFRLREIIITAERKESTPVESPLAVTTVGARDLAVIRGYGLDEALQQVPGLLAQSRAGSQDIRLTIRGFGARGAGERSNTGTARGIRLLIDGIPETEPDGRTAFDLVDLESAGRIEIVRSNASALWGNASGGVINIVSDLGFDVPSARYQAAAGSFGFRRDYARAGALLGPGRALISLSNTRFEGWRAHSRSAQTSFTGVVDAPLGGATRLRVNAAAASNFFQIPGPLTRAQFDADPRQAQADTANYKPSYVQRDERRFNRIGKLGAAVEHDIDASNRLSAMLFAEPKILQRSERNTFRDFTRYHLGGSLMFRNRSVFAGELRNSLQAGIDEAYQDGAILFYTLANGQRGSGASALQQNKREGANAAGVFLQDELAIGAHAAILAGVRWDAVTYYAENFIDPSTDDRKTFARATPKLGFSWCFTPDQSVYANVGGGIEVPAGNETDPPATFGQDTVTALNPLLEPIVSTTWEAGTKHRMTFDGGLLEAFAYDAALYLIDVRNDIIPYSGGRFYFTAGRTRRAGFELGGRAGIRGGFGVQASLSLSSNRYREYLVDSVHYKNPGSFADYGGNRMAGVPEYFYTLQCSWTPSFLDVLTASATLRGVGSSYANDANTITVDRYAILSAAVSFDDLPLVDPRLRLRGFVSLQNIFDAKYAASAFINPDMDRSGKNPIYLEPGAPRSFAGSLEVKWVVE